MIDEREEYNPYRNKTCNSLQIDGKKAGDTGIYPKVAVQYKWKICNYNEFSPAGEYTVKLLDEPRQSYFKLWNGQRKDAFLETLNSSVTLQPLGSDKNCISLTKNEVLDTSISIWFISAQFEGHPNIGGVKPEGFSYCYAYAFTPIRVLYAECSMSVSTKRNSNTSISFVPNSLTLLYLFAAFLDQCLLYS